MKDYMKWIEEELYPVLVTGFDNYDRAVSLRFKKDVSFSDIKRGWYDSFENYDFNIETPELVCVDWFDKRHLVEPDEKAEDVYQTMNISNAMALIGAQ